MKTVLIVLVGSWMAGIAVQAVRFAVYRKRVRVINRSAGWKRLEERAGLRRNSGVIVLWWLPRKKENGLGFASFESQLFVNRLYFYLEGEKRRHSSPWLVACTIVIVAGCIVVFGKYGLRFVSTDEYAVRRTDGQVCQVERGKVGECGSGYPAHGMKLVKEKK